MESKKLSHPIHWQEGMFLRPEHFLHTDRHREWVERRRQRATDRLAYGVSKLEIDRDALANRAVKLVECRAILPGGTVVNLDDGPEGLEISLVDQDGDVIVYLAVAERPDIDSDSSLPSASRKRFRAIPAGDDDDLECIRLAPSLIAVRASDSSDKSAQLAGYECMPLVRITGLKRGDKPRLDEDFFPALVDLEAWKPAQILVERLGDRLGAVREHLVVQCARAENRFASEDDAHLKQFALLAVVSGAHATLHAIVGAAGIHPRVVYVELCRVVGQLAVFTRDLRIAGGELPRYDHDNPALALFDLNKRIRAMLDVNVTEPYEREEFRGYGPTTLGVDLKPDWVLEGWQWFVGVKQTEGNLSNADISDLLQNELASVAGGNRRERLDWKLGSKTKVEEIFKEARAGIGMKPVTSVPPVLPTREGWLYYEVAREGGAWRDVSSSRTLAVCVNPRLLLEGDMTGKMELKVRQSPVNITLRFCLFAVRPRA